MEIYTKTIRDNLGIESLMIYEKGRMETPLVVLDWLGLKDLLVELPNNKMLSTIKQSRPAVIEELKKEIDSLE